jgi:ribosome modulation factor
MTEEPQVSPDIHSEGMDSYLREWPRANCPYAAGSTEREAWLGGWDRTAHRERHSYSAFSLNERR